MANFYTTKANRNVVGIPEINNPQPYIPLPRQIPIPEDATPSEKQKIINDYNKQLSENYGIPQQAGNLYDEYGIPYPTDLSYSEIAKYEGARRNAQKIESGILIDRLKTDVGSRYDTALSDYKNTSAQRRQELAQSLSNTAQQNFQLQNPYILEDLNARGVFSSPTAVAQAQAQALKELELGNQNTLNSFDAAQRQYEDAIASGRLQSLNELEAAKTSQNLQITQDDIDAIANLQRSQLEGQLAADQAARQEQLARDLAEQQAAQAEKLAYLQTGGSLLSGYLLSGGRFGFGGGGIGGSGGTAGLAGGGGTLSYLSGGASTPLGSSLMQRAGVQGPLTESGTLGGSGLGSFGSLAGGTGLGLLGAKYGRESFGGGNDLGSIAGGGIGYLIGGPLGAGVGAYAGTGAQRLGENIYQQAQNKLGNTAASYIKPIVDPVGTGKSIYKKARDVIKKIF